LRRWGTSVFDMFSSEINDNSWNFCVIWLFYKLIVKKHLRIKRLLPFLKTDTPGVQIHLGFWVSKIAISQ
jgi:hypothetical protein